MHSSVLECISFVLLIGLTKEIDGIGTNLLENRQNITMENRSYFKKLQKVAAKNLETNSLDSGNEAHMIYSTGYGRIRNLFLAEV